MSNEIPRSPKQCVHCLMDERYRGQGPCDAHRGPDGKPRDYDGPDVYKPSGYVIRLTGKLFIGPEGVYRCIGHDPRTGFLMVDVEFATVRDISERAINRTYHQVRDTHMVRILNGLLEMLVPEKWTTRQYACDEAGETVSPSDPKACRWCLLGAITKVSSEYFRPKDARLILIAKIYEALDLTLKPGIHIERINDDPRYGLPVARGLVRSALRLSGVANA